VLIDVTIDSVSITVKTGTTILEAANQAGIHIPTLCYSSVGNKIPHVSSCSVCLVFWVEQNQLVTACDTRLDSPATIQTGSPEAILARQQSLEMLISEHKGDCTAPCTRACPAHYPIPGILKHLYTTQDVDTAFALFNIALGDEIACIACTAPCIPSCRRKQIDESIDIRTLFTRVFGGTRQVSSPEENIRIEFSSTLGRLQDDAEKTLVAASSLESITPAPRSPFPEAGKCLQCSCVKEENCSLRTLCNGSSVRNGTFKIGKRSRLHPVIRFTHLVVNANICILCRRCERLALTRRFPVIPHIWFRGDDSLITFPEENDSLNRETAAIFASECPTGALSLNPFPVEKFSEIKQRELKCD